MLKWLLDCTEHFYKIDDVDAAGDALLLFSDMQREPLRLIQDRIAPFLNDGRSRRFHHIALRAACRSLEYMYMDESPYHHSFSHAVLKAICPMVPNERYKDNVQITNAINLLNFTEWPEGSDLAISPLPEIQLLVLLLRRLTILQGIPITAVPLLDTWLKINPICFGFEEYRMYEIGGLSSRRYGTGGVVVYKVRRRSKSSALRIFMIARPLRYLAFACVLWITSTYSLHNVRASILICQCM
jgi:hypothetical protein